MDKKIESEILKIKAAYSESFQNLEYPLMELEDMGNANLKLYCVKFYYKNIAIFKSYRKFPKLWDEDFEINKIKWLLIKHFQSKKIIV